MDPVPILYDRDCGVCRTILAGLLTWDRDRRLRPVEIQSPEGEALLAGMTEKERMDSWHLVGSGGVLSAGAAFPDLFELLPGGTPLAELTRRVAGGSERGYRLVAGNRSKLSKLVPGALRDRADALIAQRR
jgi:predicted DCC family thiol-disulfide oxidoreductase YuxK